MAAQLSHRHLNIPVSPSDFKDPSVKTGAEVLVESFLAHRIHRLFVYPGGTIAPIFDAAQAVGIELVTARHEQGAGYMALAAARLQGQVQVAMVTSGPGVTNVVTPVADAWFDSIPLVLITGQVGTADLRGGRPIRQRGFQEVDACALLQPLTKARFQPQRPDELPAVFAAAARIALEGRPGPVLIDLPMNVQRGACSATPTIRVEGRAEPATPDETVISRMAVRLAEASRPVILAGNGVRLAGAAAIGSLRRLARMGGIPVTQSLPALGVFPTADPLALGFHGHTGNQTAGLALHHADCILACGTRLDVRQTGSLPERFAPDATILRIELDPAELEHARVRSELTLQADVGPALAALVTQLELRPQADRAHWHARIRGWQHKHPLSWPHGELLAPQQVIATANRLSSGEGTGPVIAVSGVGSHQQWAARHFDFDAPDRVWLSSCGHGAMGYDLPVAAGAQIAVPDARVLCFVGDGSLQMNLQELGLIAERRLPVKIIVLDNHRLGIVSQFQKYNWSTDPTCGDKWNPDFAAIARAYGIDAWTVSAEHELEDRLAVALAVDGPALVHCLIDPAADVSPMLLAGQTLDGMWSCC